MGASAEDIGFNGQVTAGAVHDLLRESREIVPGVDEMELVETSVGYRPATPGQRTDRGTGAWRPDRCRRSLPQWHPVDAGDGRRCRGLFDGRELCAELAGFGPQRFEETS